jgi:hypothetical protein
LHEELSSLDTADEQVRDELRRTVEEIQAALAAPPPPSERKEASFVDRLTHAARHFEETHPNLAGMIGSVIDTLGRMGI